MTDNDLAAIEALWNTFKDENPAYRQAETPPCYYFCDNKKDADDCAELVGRGIKQATTHALSWFQTNKEALPAPGDLAIVTDWDGTPRAIIKTTKVEIVQFKDITPEYAAIEGEGDKSLAYWKEVHWSYYARELRDYHVEPTADMELVCEYFETIWPKRT